MTMILVDGNESTTNPKVVDQLRDYFGKHNIISSNLGVGDMAIPLETGLLLVERKTPNDFAGSVGASNSHMFDQVNRMVNACTYSVVIITGVLTYSDNDLLILDGRESGWRGASIRASILAIQWAGCAVVQCLSGRYPQAVEEAIKLASKRDHIAYQRAQNGGRAPAINFFPDDEDDQRKIEFMMGVPGVGEKLARSLLEWVGDLSQHSLGRLADALEWGSILSWMLKSRPEGWGEVKSAGLREFLGLKDHEWLAVQTYAQKLDTEESTSEESIEGTLIEAGTSTPIPA